MHAHDPILQSMPKRALAVLAAAVCFSAVPTTAGSYMFAEQNGAGVITHPSGYNGLGGALEVTVCVDPASPNAAQMEIPLQNIADALTDLEPASPNLISGAANNIPPGTFDFESIALHEIGHCLGMAHVNLASESGLGGGDRDYTKTTRGADGAYDLGIGADGVRGSRDDNRGDDVNLHWFRIANNNPFTLAGTVDTTTYSRGTADLPGGHSYVANANRAVAALLGFDDTEAVMQQGSFADEAQRQPAADDVATLRLAMSGLDEIAGTFDDYDLKLVYAGRTTDCDVVVRFDNSATGFAQCNVSATLLAPGHFAITTATASFNTNFNWFFNDERGLIFSDGFESGNTAAWSETVP